MDPKKKIVVSLDDLAERCRYRRKNGDPVVLTSGCFDILHGGHLEYVYEASKYGFLVVGINSDEFVKKLKGENRPIRDQDDRALTMAGFGAVNLVAIFDCDYELISKVRPQVYVASSTSHIKIWEDKKRVALIKETNGFIVEMGHKKENSTTKIIDRIIQLN